MAVFCFISSSSLYETARENLVENWAEYNYKKYRRKIR
jgi:hypothetical protein